jgi:hypothetical protein
MILPILLAASLWMPLTGAYTQRVSLAVLLKRPNIFKPNELQAVNIKFDYGNSPEPQRLSRREKIALKLAQITKTTTN